MPSLLFNSGFSFCWTLFFHGCLRKQFWLSVWPPLLQLCIHDYFLFMLFYPTSYQMQHPSICLKCWLSIIFYCFWCPLSIYPFFVLSSYRVLTVYLTSWSSLTYNMSCIEWCPQHLCFQCFVSSSFDVLVLHLNLLVPPSCLETWERETVR